MDGKLPISKGLIFSNYRIMKTITPCLWFKDNALEAVNYYTSIFPNSKIINTSYYDENNLYWKAWDVLMINFILNWNPFFALNWWVVFEHNYSVSFMIQCKDQKEIDYFYTKLSSIPEEEQCWWIKDKYWLSWQLVPEILEKYLSSENKEKAWKVIKAVQEMKRIDIATLDKIYNS